MIILIIVVGGLLWFFVVENKEDNNGDNNFPQQTSDIEQEEDLIISSEAMVDDCRIRITTDKKIFFLDTNADQRTFPEYKNCKDFLINKLSPSGKFSVFQDQIKGEIILETKIYSLEKNKIFQLDVNGTSEIFDMLFLADDKLIVLYGVAGAYNDQYLKIYDLTGIFKNYLKSVNKEEDGFIDINQYLKKIILPNIGKDYVGLSITEDELIIYGPERIESGIKREINSKIDLSDLIIF